MNYTNEYSKLPFEIMERHYFKDVDDSVAPLIEKIKYLQSEGKYNKVNEIIKNRPDLAQYCFGSDYINAIDEETRNLEIYAKSKKQSIYYQSEEPSDDISDISDVWVGD